MPAPLRPTMRVRGLGNTIAWSLSGLKLRMPLIRSFSTEHMARASTGRGSRARESTRLDSWHPEDEGRARARGEGSECE